MPKGIYPRNQARKLKNQVAKMKMKRKSPVKRMQMTVLSYSDGLHRDVYRIDSLFRAIEILHIQYIINGITIEEVRIS